MKPKGGELHIMAKNFHGAISPEDAVDAKVLSEGPEAHRKKAKAPKVEPKREAPKAVEAEEEAKVEETE